MSAKEELAWTLGMCVLLVIASAFVADEASALGAALALGVPLALFVAVAYAAGRTLAAGWLSATTLGFLAVAFFENYWEAHLYKGSNSMPGFVYLFMCVPLALIALIPARAVVRRLPNGMVVTRLVLAFVVVFAIGSVVVLANLYGTR